MKKMTSMVIILLTSFLALIKVTDGRGGGGSVGGGGIPGTGFGRSGGSGHAGGIGSSYPPSKDPNAPVSGYKGGQINGKPRPGGDTGPMIIVRPRPRPKGKMKPTPTARKHNPPAVAVPKKKPPPRPMPLECKPEAKQCIRRYIYGGVGWPKYHGHCCLKLKHSVKCVCRFLKSQDVDLRNGAKGILRGCHYRLRRPCPN